MARILIVDDEPGIIEMLRLLLEDEGHEISEAGNGIEALEALGIEPSAPGLPLPDLVVMDVAMPRMDGFELNSRLQTEARAQGLPILVLTAKGQKMRELFEMAPNVAAYVQKPFNPKMLRELISGILKSRKQTHG